MVWRLCFIIGSEMNVGIAASSGIYVLHDEQVYVLKRTEIYN